MLDRAAVLGRVVASLDTDVALCHPETPSFESLPAFNDRDVEDQSGEDDAPFVGDAGVLEDAFVDFWEVDERENQGKAGHACPEEELVLVHGWEDREDLGPLRAQGARTVDAHVEEGCVEIFDLPGSDEQGEAEDCKHRGASSEDNVARRVVVLVAIFAEIAITGAVNYGDEAE